MRAALAAPVAAALLVLAGCVTAPPQAQRADTPAAREALWRLHQASLAAVDRFLMSGRVTSAELALRADLRWKENADGHYELRLAGPFGAGAVELRGDAQGVEVRNSDGVQYTSDPEGWILKRYGWTLPISGLRHWALGLPIPDSPSQRVVDDAGRLASLTQNGWMLRYTEYRVQNGYDLPRRFEADNGRVKLKLLIDQWDELPAPLQTP
ncbi:MAG: lolB [Hydrocarboniphaga sp.]|uniref:lipoprotein insertase outer membrane protein LolB n=1 Tax=Hydrocarboniphaga sp. TaxID=2033016 RepID=UPI002608BE98|nr:lipoprotein insertase outer membrane protein LolB [Hydrocarboniphaga sp.]MDB5969818.1 lolB [Hydrocarboniphaga sp.]